MIARIFKSTSSQLQGGWTVRSKLYALSVGGLATWASARFLATQLHANSQESSGRSLGAKLPVLTLYQYETCPFCCKLRAFLDYYGVDYKKVEVNPLFKKEVKFSSYQKVPIVTANEIQINDSSFVISVIRTAMLHEGDISKAMDWYPELRSIDEKGKEMLERANMYNVMYGNADDLQNKREERKWRKWVDTRLIHALAPNIYQTPRQSLQAFRYVTQVGNFNTFERYTAQYLGAAIMYILAKRLRKKYELQLDVRQVMYDYVNKWMKAIGKDRKYLGGDEPNLADLAVYGVLSATEGLDTFNDVMKHTEALPWYRAVQEQVKEHRGAPPTPTA